MVQQLSPDQATDIIYPDSDGQPMADNTKQFRWIVVIKENLEILFANDDNVFVAGDLLWYPVEGNPKIRRAPDAMVAIGRPKGDRGSYQQWREDNIAPQVVFEVLSPGNTLTEIAQKQQFYDRYGVEEYYLYDPDKFDFSGWVRNGDRLDVVADINGWISPLLGIRFEPMADGLQIYMPSGAKFLTFVELSQLKQATERRLARTQQQLEQSQQQLEQSQQQIEQEQQRADSAEARAEALEAKLRELGVDPNS